MENEDLICPICDKFIFETYCDFDVCPVCGWENDGVQAWNHNYSGGANHLSVNEARIEYFLLKRNDTKERAMKLQKQYQDACAEIYKRDVWAWITQRKLNVLRDNARNFVNFAKNI